MKVLQLNRSHLNSYNPTRVSSKDLKLKNRQVKIMKQQSYKNWHKEILLTTSTNTFNNLCTVNSL